MKTAMLVLWPSFLAAGLGEVLFFTAFDPSDFDASRTVAYTAGFFAFWALAAASSGLTCLMQRK